MTKDELEARRQHMLDAIVALIYAYEADTRRTVQQLCFSVSEKTPLISVMEFVDQPKEESA